MDELFNGCPSLNCIPERELALQLQNLGDKRTLLQLADEPAVYAVEAKRFQQLYGTIHHFDIREVSKGSWNNQGLSLATLKLTKWNGITKRQNIL